MCRTTENIFTRDTRELYIIGFLPTVYYLFDYSFIKLSNLLYSGNKVLVEFMGFVFCISYLAFLLVYFREYEKRQETKRYGNLMEMQFLSIQKEVNQVKSSKLDYIEEIGHFNDDTVCCWKNRRENGESNLLSIGL